MQQPQQLLAERRQRLDHLLGQMNQQGHQQLQRRRHRLELAIGKLSLLNPAQVLQRGYAMTERQGRLITSVKELNCGDQLQLILKDGQCSVQVLAAAGKEE